jgi:hypothetical protein
MMFYRVLPTNVRAMALDCTPEIFINEYFKCWTDPDRSTSQLYELVLPFLLHWERMLTQVDYQKDISYVTLCRRLYPKAEDPQALLRSWAHYAQNTTSVREELELLFFQRLRGFRYIPKQAVPEMAEYVIAKDFRDRFKDLVLYRSRRPLDIPCAAVNFDLMTVEDKHPDYYLLKSMGLDVWESYLLELMKLGMTAIDISALTHIPRKTLFGEDTQIWHQLKQKWHQV